MKSNIQTDKSNIFIKVISVVTIFISVSIVYYTLSLILKTEIVFLGINSVSEYINVDYFSNFSFSAVELYIRIVLYGVMAVCSISLLSGIGLYRYKNRARISFTVMSMFAVLVISSGVSLYWYFRLKYLNLITKYLMNKLLDFFYEDILVYKIVLIGMLLFFLCIAYKLNFTEIKYKFVEKENKRS